jgi:predicted RNase H-like nuclease (RuvC/YqgF family)
MSIELQQLWYRHPSRWLALSVVGVQITLFVIVVVHRNRNAHLKEQSLELGVQNDQAQAHEQQLKSDLEDYRNMVERYSAQKSQLTHDVLQFQSELDLLNQKTKSLERVHGDMTRLESGLNEYTRAQQSFLKHLTLLEGQTKNTAGSQ